jgi:hypothetical protein
MSTSKEHAEPETGQTRQMESPEDPSMRQTDTRVRGHTTE